MGHLMRCLALARAWRDQSGAVVLISHAPPPAVARRFADAGAEIISLPASHPDPADRDRLARAIAGQRERPWVVLDGYHFDAQLQQALRAAGARLLVIDDTAHLARYHADVILNQNLGAEQLPYACTPETMLLLGTRYLLLRPEFTAAAGRPRPAEPARRVLVTMGGGDPDQVGVAVLGALGDVRIDGLEAAVVIGPATTGAEMVERAAAAAPFRVQLVRDAEDMPRWMAWADVAVSAAGTTAWELAVMGVPALLLVRSVNQARAAQMMAAQGAAVDLGPAAVVDRGRLAGGLRALLLDEAARKAMADRARLLVDGEGVSRVLTVMAALDGRAVPERAFVLRRAESSDALAIWLLANDPAVRVNSFNPDPIPLPRHLEWYNQKLASADVRLWVLDLCGVPVGQVRYERLDAEAAEVHFAVAGAFRGRGLGTRLLNDSVPEVCAQWRVRRVRGLVLPGNAASVRAFEKAGFARLPDTEARGKRCHVFERRCP